MDLNTICAIKNRSSSLLVYKIPEKNIRREFAPGETKRIPFEEIRALSYQPGGSALIMNYLQVNQDVLSALGYRPEPEYFMNESQIKDLLINGTLDEFLDCLDFAPSGVINLIKQYSVTLPLNDLQKRRALKKFLGFDVDKAIVHVEEDKQTEEETINVRTRRVVQNDTSMTTGRRTQPKYKVVNRGE